MLAEAAIVKVSNPLQIINLVLDGLTSENSKRAYGKALNDFMSWYQKEPTTGLTKATVQQYKTILQNSGVAPSTVNLRLSAIRKLAQEAADNGFVDQSMASSISRVKGVKSQGVRSGNWLTKEQAQELLDIPDCKTIKGLRDRAILAVFLGAGLRRSEVSSLSFAHIQQREGRWVFVDLVGKGNRVRTIPIPSWVKSSIDEWVVEAGISVPGLIFRPIHKGRFINGNGMTSQAIQDVVKLYSRRLSFVLSAHDLRRTFAKLAHKGGAGLDQIQLSLGHASIKTTERYLGITQDLTDAPCDHLGLRINGY
jgi:site-specific recombinase XerD